MNRGEIDLADAWSVWEHALFCHVVEPIVWDQALSAREWGRALVTSTTRIVCVRLGTWNKRLEQALAAQVGSSTVLGTSTTSVRVKSSTVGAYIWYRAMRYRGSQSQCGVGAREIEARPPMEGTVGKHSLVGVNRTLGRARRSHSWYNTNRHPESRRRTW